MRPALVVAVAVLAMARPSSASAQGFAIDLTPTIESAGIAVVGAIDVAALTAVIIEAAGLHGRSMTAADLAIVLGALELAASAPAWWSYVDRSLAQPDIALAGASTLAIGGASLLIASILERLTPRSFGRGALSTVLAGVALRF